MADGLWNISDYLHIGVPICAEECDAWYEDCKNDLICVQNVLSEYNKSECSQKCVKYSEMYGNGESLCTKMWGDSYKYVKNNGENCMKFWFDAYSPNPNAKVLKEGNGSALKSTPVKLLKMTAMCVIFAVLLW